MLIYNEPRKYAALQLAAVYIPSILLGTNAAVEVRRVE